MTIEVLLVIVVVVVYCLSKIVGYKRNKNVVLLFSPLMFFVVFGFIYLILPSFLYWPNINYIWLGVNFSDEAKTAQFCYLLVFFTLWFVELLPFKPYKGGGSHTSIFQLSLSGSGKTEFRLGLFSIVIFAYILFVSGSSFSFKGGILAIYMGSGGAVASYAISLLYVTMVCSLYLYAKRETRYAIILGAAYLFISLALGFRFRVAIYLMLLFLVSLCINRKLNVFYVALWVGVAFLSIGVMGALRGLGGRLSLERADGLNSVDNLIVGLLNDSNIMFSFGALVEARLKDTAYLGFQELFYALIHPIPRALWPDKPVFDSGLLQVIDSDAIYTAGAAIPFAGSLFNMYGFFSLIFGYMICGILLRLIHRRASFYYQAGAFNHYVIGYLVVGSGWLYANTRGYIPQLFQDFLFMVMPIALIAFLASRKV